MSPEAFLCSVQKRDECNMKLPYPGGYEPEEFADGGKSGLFSAVCRKLCVLKESNVLMVNSDKDMTPQKILA
jgi:hypothetical protein